MTWLFWGLSLNLTLLSLVVVYKRRRVLAGAERVARAPTLQQARATVRWCARAHKQLAYNSITHIDVRIHALTCSLGFACAHSFRFASLLAANNADCRHKRAS